MYGGIRKAVQSNGADGYPEAAILNGTLGAPATVKTGLTIFEELQLIRRHGEPSHRRIELLSTEKSSLSRSLTHVRGEWLKQMCPSFVEFQLKESIESMWSA